jgi:hypothetical protein
VVDIDYDNVGLLEFLMKHLGPTFVVKTPHGFHMYYKSSDAFPNKIWLDLDKLADYLHPQDYILLSNHPRTKKIRQSTGKNLIVIEFKKRVMAIGSIYSPKLEQISKYRTPTQEEISSAHVYHMFYKHKVNNLTLEDIRELYPFIPENNTDNFKKDTKKYSLPFVYSCPSRGFMPISDILARRIRSLESNWIDNVQASYWDESIIEQAVIRRFDVRLGKAIRCYLHEEREPSAAFYRTKRGDLRYFEFHNRGELRSLSAPEFINAAYNGIEQVSINGDGYYVLALRTALTQTRTALPEQLQQAKALVETAKYLAQLVPHRKAMEYAKLLDLYARYVAFDFGSDIFSVRFAAKLLGVSKTKAWQMIRTLVEAGIITIVGTKSMNKPRQAYVYSVNFSVGEAKAKAMRLLYILKLTPKDRGQQYERIARRIIGGSLRGTVRVWRSFKSSFGRTVHRPKTSCNRLILLDSRLDDCGARQVSNPS